MANDQRQQAVAKQIEAMRNLADTRFQLGQSVKGAPYAGKESVIQSVHQYLNAARASEEIQDLPSRDTAVTAATFTGDHLLHTFPHDTRINDLTFSADDRLMLAWEKELRRATLWDLKKGTLISRPVQNDQELRHAVLSPDGRFVLTWGRKNAVKIVRASDGVAVGNPVQHEAEIHLAVFSPDSSKVFSWSGEGLAQIWKAEDGSILKQVADVPVLSGCRAAFNAQGTCLVAANDQDVPVIGWRTTDGFKTSSNIWNEEVTSPWCFSPDGRQLLISTVNRGIRLWNTSNSRVSDFSLGHGAYMSRFSPDGKRVLTGSSLEGVILRNAEDGVQIGKPLPHDPIGISPNFSPDGRFIVTWLEGLKTVLLWNSLDASPTCFGQSQKTFHHGDTVRDALFSADGQLLLTLFDGVKVWRVDTFWTSEVEPRITEDTATLSGARFTRDGKILTWDEDGGRIRLWKAPRIHPETKKLPGASNCSLSHNGQQMLAWNGKAMQQRDSTTGEAFGPVMEHDQEIEGVTFSPDGLLALSWTSDNKAWFWQLSDGRILGTPIPHTDDLDGASFQESSSKVLTLAVRDKESVTSSGDPHRTYFTQVWETYDDWKTRQLVSSSEKSFLNQGADFYPKLVKDGKSVLLFSDNATVLTVWDMIENKAVGTSICLRHPCTEACLSPDGNLVLAAHPSLHMASLWRVLDGQPIGRELKVENFSSTTYSACGRYVFSFGRPSGIWATHGQRLLARFDLDIRATEYWLAGGCRTLISRSMNNELFLTPLPKPPRDRVDDLILEFEVRSASTLENTDRLRPLSQSEWEERRARMTQSASQDSTP